MRAGDIGFSRIGGFTGLWVSLGQLIIGDPCRYTHAYIVLDDDTVIEAMPGGARIASIHGRSPADGMFYYSRLNLDADQRAAIVREARALIARPGGVKYGFSDYLALALARLGIKPKMLLKYIANNNRMICSQLVDYVYCKADIKLFNDGRPSQEVTPGDLFYGIAERYGSEVNEWIS